MLRKILIGDKIEKIDSIPMTLFIKTLKNSHDWAIDRIHILCDKNKIEDAHAIQAEFKEWLNPEIEEHDVFSLEYIGD